MVATLLAQTASKSDKKFKIPIMTAPKCDLAHRIKENPFQVRQETKFSQLMNPCQHKPLVAKFLKTCHLEVNLLLTI
jgi:hypothetical protein